MFKHKMSFESAFYNKYAHLTNYSARELLQTLICLYNHTKLINQINDSVIQNGDDVCKANSILLVRTIQDDFLTKREMLCLSNEMICQKIRKTKQNFDAAYETISKVPEVSARSVSYIKKKKNHFDQISIEHALILDKQDARLTSTIEIMNKILACQDE